MNRRKFLEIAGKSSLGLVLSSQMSAENNSNPIGGEKN